MTKEDIQKVLELALEYYKLEVFGTDKESQPPTQERIDYIYERIQPSLSSDLDEEAEISDLEAKNLADDYTKFLAAGLTNNEPRPIGPQWMKKLALDRFKAGAKWMLEQGETHELTIESPVLGPPMICCPVHANNGDKVIVQIRKKQ